MKKVCVSINGLGMDSMIVFRRELDYHFWAAALQDELYHRLHIGSSQIDVAREGSSRVYLINLASGAVTVENVDQALRDIEAAVKDAKALYEPLAWLREEVTE